MEISLPREYGFFGSWILFWKLGSEALCPAEVSPLISLQPPQAPLSKSSGISRLEVATGMPTNGHPPCRTSLPQFELSLQGSEQGTLALEFVLGQKNVPPYQAQHEHSPSGPAVLKILRLPPKPVVSYCFGRNCT